ncbi:MAG: DUF5050 domain-containing protein [Eubacterium sp.]|nr:DUF5050 domain-containing protein [Eubacterium sp.]
MKKRIFTLTVCACLMLTVCACLMLTACASSIQGGEYVSVPDIGDGGTLQLTYDPATFADVRSNTMSSRATFDGRYMYNHEYKLDTASHTMTDVCDAVGCKHDDAECKRHFFNYDNYAYAYNGGFYYFKYDTPMLYYTKDGEITEIYRNEFTTDYEKKIDLKPGAITQVLLVEDGLICKGADYFYKLDFDGSLIYPHIKIPEGGSGWNLATPDGVTVFFSNQENQLTRVNLETGEVTYLKEHAVLQQLADGRLYYLVADGTLSRLMSCDTDGEDEQTIMEQKFSVNAGGGSFVITGDCVFYEEANDRFSLYRYNTKTGDTDRVIYIPDIVEEYEKDHPNINLFGTVLFGAEYIPSGNFIAVWTLQESGGSQCCILLDRNGENPVCCAGENLWN